MQQHRACPSGAYSSLTKCLLYCINLAVTFSNACEEITNHRCWKAGRACICWWSSWPTVEGRHVGLQNYDRSLERTGPKICEASTTKKIQRSGANVSLALPGLSSYKQNFALFCVYVSFNVFVSQTGVFFRVLGDLGGFSVLFKSLLG